MAGRVYQSVEEFWDAMEAALPAAMEEYVAPFVENVLRQHIASDIYGVYTPHPDGWVNGTYQRRHVLEEAVVSKMNGGTLETTSTANPSASILGHATLGGDDGGFFDLLASDNMGLWAGGFPRPAVVKAQAEIDSSVDTMENLLQKGLEAIVG